MLLIVVSCLVQLLFVSMFYFVFVFFCCVVSFSFYYVLHIFSLLLDSPNTDFYALLLHASPPSSFLFGYVVLCIILYLFRRIILLSGVVVRVLSVVLCLCETMLIVCMYLMVL